jgi:hypothetical protein
VKGPFVIFVVRWAAFATTEPLEKNRHFVDVVVGQGQN